MPNPVSAPALIRLTPPGRGAVAGVRLMGDPSLLDAPPPLFLAANGRPAAEQPIDRICFGRWGTAVVEDVVLCRIDAATTEIHCHGGEAAVGRIRGDLQARGVGEESSDRPATPESIIDDECLHALTQATTLRTADILLQQCGLLSAAISGLRFASRADALRTLDDLQRWTKFGLHLTQPWRVVLCGRPNVGKSSLINALLGYSRSIVFDQPGTTRDVVTGETALDGWPVEFSDTAGLREGAEPLEAAGIVRARAQLATADLQILVLDRHRPLTDEDRRLMAAWPDSLMIGHKSDLPCAWGNPPAGLLNVSSKTGAGLAELADAIVQRLVPEVPRVDTPLPINARQAAALEEARRAIRATAET